MQYKALLISGGNLYSPFFEGHRDLLVIEGRITSIDEGIDEGKVRAIFPDLEVIDASGSIVVPGFIDQHNHFNGAGGEGGPQFRTPPVQLSTFVEAGITGAVGLLGTDGISRSLEELLAKARGLEAEGLSTWIYTGSYQIPSPTITGSVMKDLTVIDKVIGVKMALSDHRCSHPTVEEIRRLISDVRVAGMLAGKPGVICVHMGSEVSGLAPIREALEGLEVPLDHVIPTHVGRNETLLGEAVDYVKAGGLADITAGDRTPGHVQAFIDGGADLSRVTLSSDGNGSMPKFDEDKHLIGMGVGNPSSLITQIKACHESKVAPLETLLPMVSSSVADHLGLKNKGYLKTGFDADLLVLDKTLSIKHVVSKGRVMMKDGEVLVKGTFE